MVKKYNHFLLEYRGYPENVDEIYNLIEDICMEQFNKYLDRKGKFSNYNNKTNIKWNEYSDKIDNTKFIKFPVEEIDLKFGINLNKDYDELSPEGTYYNYDLDLDIKSEVRNSLYQNITNKSIKLKIDVGLIIPRDFKSLDINKAKDTIKYTILHELTHGYQDYMQKLKNIPLTNEYNNLYFNLDQRLEFEGHKHKFNISEIYQLSKFFWILYKISKLELNADISALKKSNEIFDELIKLLKRFNIENFINDTKEELEELYSKETSEIIINNFGEIFVFLYKESCDIENVKPNKKIVNLKNKDLKGVLEYWDKIFKTKLKYINKKIHKF